jgi:hypothetical protein
VQALRKMMVVALVAMDMMLAAYLQVEVLARVDIFLEAAMDIL